MDDAAVTDAALRARHGDHAAAELFVRATQRQVWMLLTHLCDRGVAEDLTQETFERAFGALRRFRGESSARTWLLAIARRVAVDHLRRRGRRPRVAFSLDHDDGAALPLATREDLSEGVVLRAALGTLDPDRHAAFVLTQVIGLSYADAAEVCDCPVGTIRSRVARARADLVELLEGQDPTGGAEGGSEGHG